MADIPPHPNETAKAAAAAAAYCTLGPDRSLAKLADVLGQRAGKARARIATLEKWSSAYAWVERAASYDLALRSEEETAKAKAVAAAARRKAERDARRADARERMEDERAHVMRGEWARAMKAVNDLMEAGQYRGMVGLVSLLKLALDEERQALGGPTQTVEISGPEGGPIEVADAADNARRKLARLAAVIGAGSVPSESDYPGSTGA